MDHINMVFTNACLPTSKFNPAVCAAIKIAKKTLNQYYSLMDASESYQIAMGKSLISFSIAIITVLICLLSAPSLT
jgi:hypothetical protein